jgi:L-amino acid N-acyltransferase
MMIRTATHDDLPAILDIYNEAVLNTTASYDYDPHTLAQRTAWFQQHADQGLPIIVAVDAEGVITGWGSLSKFREKIGYQHSVEHSLYIHAGYRGQGIGRTVLLALVARAQELGKHAIIGGVDSSNTVSQRLHESCGFQQVAHFQQVGYKFNRWLDILFYQRILGG